MTHKASLVSPERQVIDELNGEVVGEVERAPCALGGTRIEYIGRNRNQAGAGGAVSIEDLTYCIDGVAPGIRNQARKPMPILDVEVGLQAVVIRPRGICTREDVRLRAINIALREPRSASSIARS